MDVLYFCEIIYFLTAVSSICSSFKVSFSLVSYELTLNFLIFFSLRDAVFNLIEMCPVVSEMKHMDRQHNIPVS